MARLSGKEVKGRGRSGRCKCGRRCDIRSHQSTSVLSFSCEVCSTQVCVHTVWRCVSVVSTQCLYRYRHNAKQADDGANSPVLGAQAALYQSLSEVGRRTAEVVALAVACAGVGWGGGHWCRVVGVTIGLREGEQSRRRDERVVVEDPIARVGEVRSR